MAVKFLIPRFALGAELSAALGAGLSFVLFAAGVLVFLLLLVAGS